MWHKTKLNQTKINQTKPKKKYDYLLSASNEINSTTTFLLER